MSELPSRRRRLGLRRDLLLALAPTLTVLLVLALVEAVSRQRLLFASLASSAFLIYLDPQHSVNQARTLLLSQLGAAFIGMACFLLLGPGYLSAGTAMVLAIVAMILCDAVHPPAVAAGSMRSPPAAHMACAASGKRKKGCMLCMQPFDPATEFWCR